MAIPYPHIDPVALQIGPLSIKWYGISYLAALLIGWYFIKRYNTSPQIAPPEKIDDAIFWIMLGVIAGGRLGFVVFYQPELLFSFGLFAIWQGGMSFHGGLIGVCVAAFMFCRQHNIKFLLLGDLLACVAPIGLFLGRIANFINGEVYGRPSDVPWAMVFPQGGPVARHPSQLYEAFLEGIVLFLMLYALRRFFHARQFPGMLTGFFLIGYGVFRSLAELFRQPDGTIDLFFTEITYGQTLSFPMIIVGIIIIIRAIKRSFAI